MKSEASLSSVWKLSGPAVALVLLGTLLGASCGGVPKTYYYSLGTPSPPAPSDPKTNFRLGVEHFRAPAMLRDDRIVYYESPTQMNFYQYQRWGADPATLLSEYVAAWIDSLGVFAGVRMLPTREAVDYTLNGRVANFEEVDDGGESRGRVGLHLWLMRARDRKVIWSTRRLVETPIQEKGMGGVVNALKASCMQLLREATPGLLGQIEQDYKAGGVPSR